MKAITTLRHGGTQDDAAEGGADPTISNEDVPVAVRTSSLQALDRRLLRADPAIGPESSGLSGPPAEMSHRPTMHEHPQRDSNPCRHLERVVS